MDFTVNTPRTIIHNLVSNKPLSDTPLEPLHKFHEAVKSKLTSTAIVPEKSRKRRFSNHGKKATLSEKTPRTIINQLLDCHSISAINNDDVSTVKSPPLNARKTPKTPATLPRRSSRLSTDRQSLLSPLVRSAKASTSKKSLRSEKKFVSSVHELRSQESQNIGGEVNSADSSVFSSGVNINQLDKITKVDSTSSKSLTGSDSLITHKKPSRFQLRKQVRLSSYEAKDTKKVQPSLSAFIRAVDVTGDKSEISQTIVENETSKKVEEHESHIPDDQHSSDGMPNKTSNDSLFVQGKANRFKQKNILRLSEFEVEDTNAKTKNQPRLSAFMDAVDTTNSTETSSVFKDSMNKTEEPSQKEDLSDNSSSMLGSQADDHIPTESVNVDEGIDNLNTNQNASDHGENVNNLTTSVGSSDSLFMQGPSNRFQEKNIVRLSEFEVKDNKAKHKSQPRLSAFMKAVDITESSKTSSYVNIGNETRQAPNEPTISDGSSLFEKDPNNRFQAKGEIRLSKFHESSNKRRQPRLSTFMRAIDETIEDNPEPANDPVSNNTDKLSPNSSMISEKLAVEPNDSVDNSKQDEYLSSDINRLSDADNPELVNEIETSTNSSTSTDQTSEKSSPPLEQLEIDNQSEELNGEVSLKQTVPVTEKPVDANPSPTANDIPMQNNSLSSNSNGVPDEMECLSDDNQLSESDNDDQENNDPQSSRIRKSLSKVKERAKSTRKKSANPFSNKLIKHFFNRFASFRVSSDALAAVEHHSVSYHKWVSDQLFEMCRKNGSKVIRGQDVLSLMKKQGFIRNIHNIHSFAEKHLPLELRSEVLPIAGPGNEVYSMFK